jgi:isopentenyl-diphosphate Delta-isomerase
MNDSIVLVNEKNEPIGTADKLETHHTDTPLHRGFSLFLFNEKGELLLQQRSDNKKTWPNTWSNSVCGHPQLDETPIAAAKRRLAFELGIQNANIQIILPNYQYRFEKDGIVENEICPVMVSFSEEHPKRNPDEVQSVKWIPWKDWLTEIEKSPHNYSPWCVEETFLLCQNKTFKTFLTTIIPFQETW